MKNNIEELFNGIAVVIDNEIEDTKSEIYKIVEQIKAKNIPILKYTELPEEDVEHFQNLSFLILDWHLEIIENVNNPTEEIIQFIIDVNDKCFCPIFIFTNKKEDVIAELEETELENCKNIFIERKSKLINGDDVLFSTVTKWLKKTPSIYVLKEWDKEYRDSKNKLFLDFYKMSPEWPCIMWENLMDNDQDNEKYKSLEMGELISKNLYSRMSPFQFEDSILNNKPRTDKDKGKDIIKVLEGERYLKKENIHPDDIKTGDIFKTNDDKYYLNIRAQCDLVRCDNPELYLLLGERIERNEITRKKIGTKKNIENVENKDIYKYSFKNGQTIFKTENFPDSVNQTVIPFIDGSGAIIFHFKCFSIKEWENYKGKRIGRILPPHINKIQQQFAFYMQRQGVPRIPDKVIDLLVTTDTINENS